MVFMALKRSIQQLAYSMAMPEAQESVENKYMYLGHLMLFTLYNQRSHRRKTFINKII